MLKTIGLVAASAALVTGAGVGASTATASADSATAPHPASSPATIAAPHGKKAGDIVMPPMPVNSTGTSGTVTFQLTNNTSAPVTFNVDVSSDAQNETSIGTSLAYDYSVNPQVASGQTVDVPITAGGGGRTDGSDPVVTVGLQGYAQFEMWVHVNTWTNSDFQNIEYKGDQTGAGYTGGLSQVNLGNGSVISNGNAGINNDWTYVNGTVAGFVAG